jgi:protein TonB
MGYQALLFCPDEKTARTITQVLSELDFTVVPCTEPFGAVKKLMAEHFDAVVVDCDNEQNATLLFKSARNTPNNQTSLAVAVVEGQAGVAKAFRIGANLVLTKPINVEQAKGTLRVARGLLRKNEAAKPATAAAGPAAKSAPPAPQKPAPQAKSLSAVTARPAPIKPLATAANAGASSAAGIPAQKPTPPPKAVVRAPAEIAETDADIFELDQEVATPPIAKPAAQASTPKISSGVSATAKAKIESAPGRPAGSAGFGTSAASAPAPAREKSSEPKPSVSAGENSSTIISEPASPGDEVAASESSSSAEVTTGPAPSFTFGGNVSESAGGKNKKLLLRIAAVVLIAVVGYEVWMQWERSGGAAVGPVHVVAQPLPAPAKVPQVAPSPAPDAAASIPSSAPASAQPSIEDSTPAPQPSEPAKTSSDTPPTAPAEKAPTHSGKAKAATESAKSSASAPAANKVPATKPAPEPIVIKNGASKPAENPDPAVDAPAPSMVAIAPQANSATLPSLIGGESKAPAPVLQTVNISQGVSRGLLVKQTQPIYPPNALRLRLEGAVQLSATISRNGDISALKILSGDPLLARAAAEAVKQWKYKPYLLNGEPVEIQTQITVNFTLPH